MSSERWLQEQLEEVRHEIESWPSWMKREAGFEKQNGAPPVEVEEPESENESQ